MSLFPRLLFDTNALVYLYKLGLLKVCVGAVAKPCTSDLIVTEMKKNLRWEDVEPYGMQICTLTSEMMTEVEAVKRGPPTLSICDASLIVLAKKYGIPVFTDDGTVVKVMSSQEIRHVSLPEMVDSLVNVGKISYEEAVPAFGRIYTEFLPRYATKNYPEILEKYPETMEIMEKYPTILETLNPENNRENREILEKYPKIQAKYQKIWTKYQEILEKYMRRRIIRRLWRSIRRFWRL